MDNPHEWLAELREWLELNKTLEKLVAAIDDLNTAVANLTTEVNDVLANVGQGVSDAEAETIVTDLNNLAAQISAALNPPPPAG